MLSYATDKGCDKIPKLLALKKLDVDTRDTHGRTPLMFANNVLATKILIEHGSDVDIADHYGQTALHYAAGRKGVDVVRLLLDKGAYIHALGKRGRNILHHFSFWKPR